MIAHQGQDLLLQGKAGWEQLEHVVWTRLHMKINWQDSKARWIQISDEGLTRVVQVWRAADPETESGEQPKGNREVQVSIRTKVASMNCSTDVEVALRICLIGRLGQGQFGLWISLLLIKVISIDSKHLC